MDAVTFQPRWIGASYEKERTASQPHFYDLCDLLGVPKPLDDPDSRADYTFEKGVGKPAVIAFSCDNSVVLTWAGGKRVIRPVQWEMPSANQILLAGYCALIFGLGPATWEVLIAFWSAGAP